MSDEDMLDVARAREIKSRGEETFPSSVVEALIAGENPVRVYRQHRGLTTAQLAEKSGVSQSHIEEMEDGKIQGQVASMEAVALALGVDLDDLVLHRKGQPT
ncbi:helix-turn-helix transcriptional regulator [Pararhizobium sp. BT-229]|uniref:helix-turn-helix transcriptional regulator n=1 Tax=Pararhizobium sp. BT-229 TaxID=2986923 RepID=UPI0021F6CA68|nr:helix-turn-helix transcriptional regulator [Pararhizobium sp. BT-229]MCV9965677.1 helix-turn-helix transcriptional regulator [Pararhizobium sp. BT-229]